MGTRRTERRRRRERGLRPPLRAGLGATSVVLPDAGPVLLAHWLEERFGPGSGEALARGDVFADFGEQLAPDAPYVPGQRVWLFRPVPDEPAEPIILPVVAETENWVAVDKPHGIATIPRGGYVARSAVVAARRQFSNDDLVPAHRLDAGTAGVLLLVKRPEVRGAYQRMFQGRHVEKEYEAIAPLVGELGQWRRVELRLEKEHGELAARVVDGEPNAITDLAPVEALGDGLARWMLRPHTGKTHQLRATLAAIGAPIAFDPLFPQVLSADAAQLAHPLQLLARTLEFHDPISGDQVKLVSNARLALG
ncbi:tRNA pseudouridine32 synthase/23S rRNA pseudouridine746 synthase [Arcanobacterium wilhelmae]|uniref:RNA pseudouridylate synthase n=1 Tax=Arcanobacterium wilhelmae TaxID=1803177 RepID=A0ABT9NCJ7_9ACTO|nr:pseudouridine synthase [Arcanobacterium wilhelmae]MDP9801439.1 tRNA pseudouridine32 synthase/23S rRNA pseudouridine746 synthase [Arcanobacterium wilhelmae]WFN90774.1 pseudouridine synthase [Arcanobacterium wilhelmae]